MIQYRPDIYMECDGCGIKLSVKDMRSVFSIASTAGWKCLQKEPTEGWEFMSLGVNDFWHYCPECRKLRELKY